MLTPQQAEDANVAKLSQLAQDAHNMSQEPDLKSEANYWRGFEDGLKRAIMVVQGRG